MENAYYWLIAGSLLLAFEAFVVPGVGFLFAGIAGLITGILVKAGVAGDHNIYAEFAWFFGLTVVSGGLFWKKMKAFRSGSKGGNYNNMVGSAATVSGGALKAGTAGQVKWSGTLMNAELHGHDEVAEGGQVEIIEVKGNTLIVKSK